MNSNATVAYYAFLLVMEKFVLNTGIILGYVRAAGYAEYVEKKFGLFGPPKYSAHFCC